MAQKNQKQGIGRLGEDIATKYIKNKGFSIIDRNYRKKYGEIDVIAEKAEILHFIEVKSVSREIAYNNVSRVTSEYRPEDNIHANKLKRLARTIQVYLAEKGISAERDWVFDAITVKIDVKARKAHVKFIKDLVL
ncbi:MAG: YraN family protein [Patescibacteria group bacterium]